jgi:cyclic-di-GMP-binding protein
MVQQPIRSSPVDRAGYGGPESLPDVQGRPVVTQKEHDMADSSFDIVSKVDRQEVDNALNQASKEISQRYDFKNVGASITWSGESIVIVANSSERVLAALDVFETKLVKRGISLKAIDVGEREPKASGKEYRLAATLKEGLAGESAKKVTKIIREEGPKGVKTQITGDEVRVTSKSRDQLQEVMALLKGSDLDFALQFTNYR